MRDISNKLIALFAGLTFFVAGCSNSNVLDSVEVDKAVETQEQAEESEETKEVEENESIDEEKDSVEGGKDSESVSEIDYLDAMNMVIDIHSDTINDINVYVSAIFDNPSLLEDSDWVDGYSKKFEPFDTLVEVMEAVENKDEVPNGYEEIHSSIKESIILTSEAGEVMIESLRADDVETYAEGVEMMNEGMLKLVETKELLIFKKMD